MYLLELVSLKGCVYVGSDMAQIPVVPALDWGHTLRFSDERVTRRVREGNLLRAVAVIRSSGHV